MTNRANVTCGFVRSKFFILAIIGSPGDLLKRLELFLVDDCASATFFGASGVVLEFHG